MFLQRLLLQTPSKVLPVEGRVGKLVGGDIRFPIRHGPEKGVCGLRPDLRVALGDFLAGVEEGDEVVSPRTGDFTQGIKPRMHAA